MGKNSRTINIWYSIKMEINRYFTESKTMLSFGRVVGQNCNIYGENVLLNLIHSV